MDFKPEELEVAVDGVIKPVETVVVPVKEIQGKISEFDNQIGKLQESLEEHNVYIANSMKEKEEIVAQMNALIETKTKWELIFNQSIAIRPLPVEEPVEEPIEEPIEG